MKCPHCGSDRCHPDQEYDEPPRYATCYACFHAVPLPTRSDRIAELEAALRRIEDTYNEMLSDRFEVQESIDAHYEAIKAGARSAESRTAKEQS